VAIKIVGNRKGIRALLTDPGVADDIHRRTRAVAAAAGPGHDVYLDDKRFRERARGAVVTGTKEARQAEADYRNLTRSVDAAKR
jgi:hypothetical protein